MWERREEFLMSTRRPTTPLLVAEGFPPVPGAATIAEFLDETTGAELAERRLMPTETGRRVEVRRLAAWFNEKFFTEVSGPLVLERFYKRLHAHRAGWRVARYRRDPCGAESTSAIISPTSDGWCAPAIGWRATA